MTRAIVILTLDETTTSADAGALASALATLPEAVRGIGRSNAGVHLPGVVGPVGHGAGAMTWDLTVSTDLDVVLNDPAVTAALDSRAAVGTAVTLAPIAAARVETPAPFVKRTLLLRVRDDVAPDALHRFESDLAEMPEHIDAIRSWSLARTLGTSPSTHGRWTHAWEQEFSSLDGLSGDYMLHPFHWTTVDAWFDPEIPDHIVEPELAHLFYASDTPVL